MGRALQECGPLREGTLWFAGLVCLPWVWVTGSQDHGLRVEGELRADTALFWGARLGQPPFLCFPAPHSVRDPCPQICPLPVSLPPRSHHIPHWNVPSVAHGYVTVLGPQDGDVCLSPHLGQLPDAGAGLLPAACLWMLALSPVLSTLLTMPAGTSDSF